MLLTFRLGITNLEGERGRGIEMRSSADGTRAGIVGNAVGRARPGVSFVERTPPVGINLKRSCAVLCLALLIVFGLTDEGRAENETFAYVGSAWGPKRPCGFFSPCYLPNRAQDIEVWGNLIYVADYPYKPRSGVVVYSSSGEPKGVLQGSEKRPYPVALAISGVNKGLDSRLYVLTSCEDTYSHECEGDNSVYSYDKFNHIRESWHLADKPDDITVGPEGNVYVSFGDFTRHPHIEVYSPSGELLRTMTRTLDPGRATSEYPIEFDSNGKLWTAINIYSKGGNYLGTRIVRFTAAGDFINSFGSDYVTGFGADSSGGVWRSGGDCTSRYSAGGEVTDTLQCVIYANFWDYQGLIRGTEFCECHEGVAVNRGPRGFGNTWRGEVWAAKDDRVERYSRDYSSAVITKAALSRPLKRHPAYVKLDFRWRTVGAKPKKFECKLTPLDKKLVGVPSVTWGQCARTSRTYWRDLRFAYRWKFQVRGINRRGKATASYNPAILTFHR